jgi:hypothetical protein
VKSESDGVALATDLPHVVDPFYRVDKSRRKKPGPSESLNSDATLASQMISHCFGAGMIFTSTVSLDIS